jgi:hypothetical protein
MFHGRSRDARRAGTGPPHRDQVPKVQSWPLWRSSGWGTGRGSVGMWRNCSFRIPICGKNGFWGPGPEDGCLGSPSFPSVASLYLGCERPSSTYGAPPSRAVPYRSSPQWAGPRGGGDAEQPVIRRSVAPRWGVGVRGITPRLPIPVSSPDRGGWHRYAQPLFSPGQIRCFPTGASRHLAQEKRCTLARPWCTGETPWCACPRSSGVGPW